VTESRALIVLLAAALVTAGCGGSSNTGSTSASPSESAVNPSQMQDQQTPPDRVTIDVTIQGGQVTPVNEQLKANLGQPIVIRVNSDAEDELHVHSTPEHSFPVKAKPGQSFQFTVDVPGKVDVELHHLDKTIASIAVQ
jgi:sporulation-control protein spo0M